MGRVLGLLAYGAVRQMPRGAFRAVEIGLRTSASNLLHGEEDSTP